MFVVANPDQHTVFTLKCMKTLSFLLFLSHIIRVCLLIKKVAGEKTWSDIMVEGKKVVKKEKSDMGWRTEEIWREYSISGGAASCYKCEPLTNDCQCVFDTYLKTRVKNRFGSVHMRLWRHEGILTFVSLLCLIRMLSVISWNHLFVGSLPADSSLWSSLHIADIQLCIHVYTVLHVYTCYDCWCGNSHAHTHTHTYMT